jgi:hypothetical protein
MTKKQLSILIASLFVASPALAQSDPFLSTGSVTVGGIVTNVNSGNRDASKFEEYQDLSNGMLSNFGFTGRNSKSWFDAYGENFGRDDLYVNLRGGMYDVFKARAYTNWIPHNLLFNGLTPYTGAGSTSLSATFPKPDTATWQPLNLGYVRKDTGGYFEWQQQSPWYFRVDGNQVKTQGGGKNFGSTSNSSSPGGGYTDLVIPVEYETNNAMFEGGYTTRTMTFTGSYMISNFGNKYSEINWNNPFWGNNVDRTFLPPANDYQRIALNGVVRDLPWKSTLAARYTWDKTESDTTIATFALNGTGAAAYPSTKPQEPEFNGKETRQTFTLGWSATPTAGLDTRAYYNWQKMKNDSTQVEFGHAPTDPLVSGLGCGTQAGLTPGSTVVGNCENELWDYKKNNAGVDAYWRLDRANRLGLGADWLDIKQSRFDFDDTTTWTLWVEWKNTSIENVTARLKYSYIDRDSDFLLGNAGTGPNDPNYLLRYVKAFDLANSNQNRLKAWIDWAPADNVGVALEGIYKINDYDETRLGRTKDRRWEIFGNVTYGTPSSWRLTLFGDYESVKYDSDHRNISAGSCPTTSGGVTATNCFDPSTPPNSIAYNWDSVVKNANWMIGLGVDYPVNDRFMVTGSLLYDKVDGSADMTAQNNYGNPLPLNSYPNVKTVSLNLKGTYNFDKNWSITGGYAYQKYDYNDDQYEGYLYSLPSINASTGVETTTQRSYLNGWNAFQTYNANIFYLLGTFRF